MYFVIILRCFLFLHENMFWVIIRMSTHDICFYGELEKIIPKLSSYTAPQQVFCKRLCFR